MKWGSVLLGAVGLAVLYAVTSSQQSAANVGGWLGGLGNLAERFISPAVPMFAQTANTTAAPTATQPATSGATATATTTTQPGTVLEYQPGTTIA